MRKERRTASPTGEVNSPPRVLDFAGTVILARFWRTAMTAESTEKKHVSMHLRCRELPGTRPRLDLLNRSFQDMWPWTRGASISKLLSSVYTSKIGKDTPSE